MEFTTITVKRHRRLFDMLAAVAYKMSLRAKRPPDSAKWPADAVDEYGNRDWLKCSPKFLVLKLREEFGELIAEVDNYTAPMLDLKKVRHEAADVAAVALMLADRLGCYTDFPKMPRIVCLCGSTKFKDQFVDMNRLFTLAGHIVLTVGCFPHTDQGAAPEDVLGEAVKAELDALHKRKIDLADDVFVLNVGGYIGSSTRSEIDYALATGKPVAYLEAIDLCAAVKSELVNNMWDAISGC